VRDECPLPLRKAGESRRKTLCRLRMSHPSQKTDGLSGPPTSKSPSTVHIFSLTAPAQPDNICLTNIICWIIYGSLTTDPGQRVRTPAKLIAPPCPSREAAEECSPWRKPWEKAERRKSPSGAKDGSSQTKPTQFQNGTQAGHAPAVTPMFSRFCV
jgi:hypothetical protein